MLFLASFSGLTKKKMFYNRLIFSMITLSLYILLKYSVFLIETKNPNWQNIYFPFTIFILR